MLVTAPIIQLQGSGRKSSKFSHHSSRRRPQQRQQQNRRSQFSPELMTYWGERYTELPIP